MKENGSRERLATSETIPLFLIIPFVFLLLTPKGKDKKMLDKNINYFLQDISHILLQEV
ncbi:MAG: hypothetical protein OP8BY_1146 [Candidatus Saccharicenans subterraneus]|uniref:Uncharacterized protein n=1 Tax=Candidatus Saccharicenans subterraneus TaxID=2508984 RepID=A0A3E2BJZ8_9BACT|nr:MAG: hypothetical protein OP8BY_1146 [Candidatus Saccharicenans subterraneum]